MPVSDEYRRNLHAILDEVLDDVDAEHPKMMGVLILREVIVVSRSEFDRHLLIRGVLGKHADLLRELSKRLKAD